MLPGLTALRCKNQREGKTWDYHAVCEISEMDKVTGLMIGADDYVPKPFSVTELILSGFRTETAPKQRGPVSAAQAKL